MEIFTIPLYCMLWPTVYLQFADSHSQSPANSVVNSECKICQLVWPVDQKVLKMLEQLSCCEMPISVVLGKVIKKLESNNSWSRNFSHFGFLWMLRRHVKCHLRVTEQFIWKHIWVVQEKIELTGIPSEEQRRWTCLRLGPLLTVHD